MKCSKCDKGFDDSYAFCPFCAEPRPVKEIEAHEKPLTRRLTFKEWWMGLSRKAKRLACGGVTLGLVAIIIIVVVVTAAGGSSWRSTETMEFRIHMPEFYDPAMSESVPKGADITLKTAGITKWERGSYYSIGGILTNPNKDLAATQVGVEITVFDADGVILETKTENVGLILPESEMAFESSYNSETGPPARMDVRPMAEEWQKTDKKAPLFSFENTNYLEDKVTGMVVNNSGVALDWLRIYIVGLDASGNAIAGEGAYARNVAPGQQAPFETKWPATLPEGGSFAFFATVGWPENDTVLQLKR